MGPAGPPTKATRPDPTNRQESAMHSVTYNGKVHPAADVFPMIEGDELDALVESVRQHGLMEPVWLTPDGTLLDGRNRMAACKASGIEPTFRVYHGDDLVDFIVRLNIHRRHLSTGQKAMAATDLLPMYEAEAKTQQGQRSDIQADLPRSSTNRQAREDAADAVGTSGRAVGQAKRVTQQAPDLAEHVRAGTIALDAAEKLLKLRIKYPDHAEPLIADVIQGKREVKAAERAARDRVAEEKRTKQAKKQRQQIGAGTVVDIRHGDFRDVLADIAGIDAIITDPPYPKEYLPLLDDLAAWADKVLAPDGILVVLFGQTHLPEVYERLSAGRPYRWTGCYLTPGPSYYSMARNVHTNWKPMLVYGGGDNFRDLVEAEGADAGAKSMHHWGQDFGAFHTIVERLTKPGQTICDPFMGSGTTLAAAQSLGRHAIGCDIDAEHVAVAQERLGA